MVGCTLMRMVIRTRSLQQWTAMFTLMESKSNMPTQIHMATTMPLRIFRLLLFRLFNTSTTRTHHPHHPLTNTLPSRLVILSRIFLTPRHTRIPPLPILPLASPLFQHLPIQGPRMDPWRLSPIHLFIRIRKSPNPTNITAQMRVLGLFLIHHPSPPSITAHKMNW